MTTRTILNRRYEVLEELGRGAQATTLMAGDIETQSLVAVKRLRWDEIEDWKAHELFQREAEALRTLSHPGIPALVDAFEEEGAYYLVQEFVQGKNLKKLLDDGHRWNPGALRRLFESMLDILEYLHGRLPPVVHRDIKPSNIILSPNAYYEKGRAPEPDESGDVRFVLVDFGAVQLETQGTVGGSTVIGTPGYMPMEQLQGQAVPATDLYALAATIVHLATGVAPNDLPIERGKVLFRHRVQLPERLARTLEACLEPLVDDRLQSVDEVRAALKGDASHMALAQAQSTPTNALVPQSAQTPVRREDPDAPGGPVAMILALTVLFVTGVAIAVVLAIVLL